MSEYVNKFLGALEAYEKRNFPKRAQLGYGLTVFYIGCYGFLRMKNGWAQPEEKVVAATETAAVNSDDRFYGMPTATEDIDAWTSDQNNWNTFEDIVNDAGKFEALVEDYMALLEN